MNDDDDDDDNLYNGIFDNELQQQEVTTKIISYRDLEN